MDERWIASVLIRTVDRIRNIDPKIIPRSILVTGFQASTTSEQLIIHFQRIQNGGGDIESITRSCKRQSAVITFHMPEVVSSVLNRLQKCGDMELKVQRYSDAERNEEVFEVVTAELCMDYVNCLSRGEIAKLLGKVKSKIGVSWIKLAESFTVSGTLEQIEEAHIFLEKGLYLANGTEVVSDQEMKDETASQPRNDHVSPPFEDQNDVKRDADQGLKLIFNGGLLPKHWTPQPKDLDGFEKTVHLHQLDPSNDADEYERVQSHFQQSCPNNIVKIERVQNPTLYGIYAIQKKKMDETKGSNEMNLFHGTPGDNCKLINHKGFNRSFQRRNSNLAKYGNGVYFALQSSYSARSTYSPPDANGYRYLYLTKVLVGEYTVGKEGLITPPPKSTADPTDTYDTMVDQVPNPSIFVVFYDWQCYPEYLITFQ